jgi:iron complex outermembrane recepter protein
MANHSPFLKVTRICAAVALCIASCSPAWAQQNPTEITITDTLPSRVSGFGNVPAQTLPFSTTVINNATLQDIGAQRVSDALLLDASVSDSYNSPAYWDILSVRGFTLDNRYNYRREGLPISAETMIPMDNKERIELLKGTSGIQAGTSAPGGLVNYVVKRAPTDAEQKIRNITFSYGQGNNRLAAADLGGRFGAIGEFGYRFNVAHEDLDPYIKDTKGYRDLVALAMDWRLKPGTVIDFEIEQSHREQIGVNGYSLLGSGANALPPTVDPTRNFVRQPWTLPGEFDALTGSVRLRQELDQGWQWMTQYGTQHLKTNDRLTFAFGSECYAPNYSYCDRFSPNGNFDIYDYRSENERRLTEALQTEVSGQAVLGNLRHDLAIGLSRQRQLDRMPATQSYSLVPGTSGNVFVPFTSSANPDFSTPNTNRSEYSTELSVKDRVQLSTATSLWAGMRHVAFNRGSEQNEHPSPGYPDNYPNAKQFSGNINVPWIGISTEFQQLTTYASHGHGVEQIVTPNSAAYGSSAGEQLGIGRSRQTEVGVRNLPNPRRFNWNMALFEITRPFTHDIYDANTNTSTRYVDGKETHQGLELGADWQSSQWKLATQTQWLKAKLSDVQMSPEIVGSTPLNIPKFVLRGMTEYRYTSVPGLRTGIRVSHEGQRNVTEDGSIQLPAWTTFGANAHYDTKVNNMASTWSLAIDNLEDKRYWRESPKQFGHYYLYPGAPRTLRATVQFRL